jgi:membrane dipeptidase
LTVSRWCCALAIVGGTWVAAPAADPPKAAEGDTLKEVRALLDTVPLIDGHNDTPWALRDRFSNRLSGFDFRDTSALDEPMHTDLRRLRAGGVGGQFWAVYVPTDLSGGDAVAAALEQIDVVYRLAADYPDDLEMALSAADVRRIHAAGRIASLIGVEGGHCIDDSLAVLRQLYALGARYMTLSHWQSTAWVDAATAPPQLGGLSPFGEAVVREMNRLGMLVDLSHVSAEAMRDALAVSRAPVIFSHSGVAAINPHPRNVPDDVLRLITANGGVVMVNFGGYFIDPKVTERSAAAAGERARLEELYPGDPERVDREEETWLEAHPIPEVSLARLADHVDHIRAVAGIDHVGLGSDFDGVQSLPEGLQDVSGYPLLLVELMRRGYSRDDVAKVAGLNMLRVMEQAERVAEGLRTTERPSEILIEDVMGETASVSSGDR